MLITLEGNIGAGKSTLLPELAQELGFQYADENVDNDSMFASIMAAGTSEQINMYMSRKLAERNLECVRKGGDWLVERCPSSSLLFGMAAGNSDEALNTIFRDVVHTPEPDLHVYIRTPLNVCLKRMRKRGRPSELEFYDKKFLRKLEDVHNDWAKVGEDLHKVLTVDYDEMSIQDLATVIKMYLEMKRVLGDKYEKEQVLKSNA
ncbi:deoxynucleoside kinase [Vibrio parahaemolyticus]|uniref:deoxynucleoside kinase n=1 Tax=Vibrio parahaemolyticus TaxID=670 RepID=UPI00041E77BD|nr:deoxynucleoside kinase [Vibrio parahaemolyticus]